MAFGLLYVLFFKSLIILQILKGLKWKKMGRLNYKRGLISEFKCKLSVRRFDKHTSLKLHLVLM